jgi:hypothetical protein
MGAANDPVAQAAVSNGNVRFWHKADMLLDLSDVCFWA